MIRYPVSRAELRRLVEDEKQGWLARATERTRKFRQLGQYDDKSTIWSEVKPAYMKLQGESKCAYCERKMESVTFGRGEQDVEHFRPKGSVKAWKPSRDIVDLGVPFAPAPPAGKGYYLLPYHIYNYAATCKPCNSVLKRDWFPIAGTYDLDANDPGNLTAERAYLMYPIGSIDEDPERVIEFYGPTPRPVAASGHRRNRALVTIEFFQLADPVARKNLYRDRAMVIMALHPLLRETMSGVAAERTAAQEKVAGFLQPRLAHLNCAKSFTRLFDQDPTAARTVYDASVRLITSTS